jgi:hypothetical protein
MSYRIEYQWASWKLAASPSLGGVDRFVIAIEGGDNNLRDSVTGKRVRSWDVCMLGSREQVLRQAVDLAGACEGGSLKPGSRNCTPEAYIRRIRCLVEGATTAASGRWYPSVRVAETHPLVDHARQMGLPIEREQRYGSWFAGVRLNDEQRELVFEFVDRFPDLRGWQLAAVSGLPPS